MLSPLVSAGAPTFKQSKPFKKIFRRRQQSSSSARFADIAKVSISSNKSKHQAEQRRRKSTGEAERRKRRREGERKEEN